MVTTSMLPASRHRMLKDCFEKRANGMKKIAPESTCNMNICWKSR